jgi:hypothetical protein
MTPKRANPQISLLQQPAQTHTRNPARHCIGLMSQSGCPYISFSRTNPEYDEGTDPSPIVMPLALAMNRAAIIDHFDQAGRPLLPEEVDRLTQGAKAVKDFTDSLLVEHSGWNVGYFAHKHGEITYPSEGIAADSTASSSDLLEPRIAFQAQTAGGARAGTLKEYHLGLHKYLADQDILTLALCVSFTPLILKWAPDFDNFVVQLVGASQTGKSTATQLAASVWGAAYKSTPEIDDINLFSYLHLDLKLLRFHHNPLFLEGADRWLAIETKRQKLENVRAFDKVLHHQTRTYGGAATHETRTVVWSTSQESIEVICEDDQAVTARLDGGLMTLRVPDRRGGVVAPFSEEIEVASNSQFIDELKQHIGRHHGHAGPHLVRAFLDLDESERERLSAKVEARIRKFVERSGVNVDDGRTMRDARRFGVIAAAGYLARQYGALPKRLKTTAAVLACYRQYRDAQPDVPLRERLQRILLDPSTVTLGRGKLPKVKEEQREKALAYVRQRSWGREVMIRPEKMVRAFSDAATLEKSPEFKALLITEEETRGNSVHTHRRCKRKLGRGRKAERVFCLRLVEANT